MTKKARKFESVEDLIEAGGTITSLARRLSEVTNEEVSIWAISKWKERGVPQKYWSGLYLVLGISEAELHYITMKIRTKRAA